MDRRVVWCSLLAGVVGASIGAVLAWNYPRSVQIDDLDECSAISTLKRDLQKEKTLRAQERSGRTNAERDARILAQKQLDKEGYNFEPIGCVSSCFADRRGTPRQGALVPGGKARIELKSSVSPTSLECLDQFSHMWVLFVFHENTNLAKVSAHKTATYPAKIAPPRLGGKKVGLFSTRTPHRPNSIGLTVVKVDAVTGRYVDISGHDLVDGTPVLDIKPYVPYDNVSNLVCPEWVAEKHHEESERRVIFSDDAIAQIQQSIPAMKFYNDFSELQSTIAQILVLDIRSLHQKRNQATYSFRVDNLVVHFQTFENEILVTSCTEYDSKVNSTVAI